MSSAYKNERGQRSSADRGKAKGTAIVEPLLEYEDYLVICCPKCFGFPSDRSTCCRSQLANPGLGTIGTSGSSHQDETGGSDSAKARSGDSTTDASGTMSIPLPSSGTSSEEDSSACSDMAASTQSSRDLAQLSYSLPPRRPTRVTTMCEEFDDFDYDEGNRFILDRDL